MIELERHVVTSAKYIGTMIATRILNITKQDFGAQVKPSGYANMFFTINVVPYVPCTQPYPFLHCIQMYIYLPLR